jgi:multiple sugar transport system substrate-binding protein
VTFSRASSTALALLKAQPTSLKMLTAGYSPAMHGRIKEKFEKMHYGVNIEMEPVPYEALHDKIVDAMKAGGTKYDIFLVDNIWTPEFVEAGWLEDVTEHISPEIKKEVFPTALEATEYPTGSGRYYGFPWYIEVKYLFYNKNILKEAGITSPPKTLDELWKQAEIIRSKGILEHPIVWSWAQGEVLICDFIILTALFGGKIVDGAGKPIFNKGGAVEALKWMNDSIDAGITNWASLAFTDNDTAKFFGLGKAAFTLAWLCMYEGINSPSQLNGACGIAPVFGSAILPEGTSVNGSMFYGISSHSKHKDVAIEFAKFWTSLDIQRSYAKWLFPTWMTLFDDPEAFQEGVSDILKVVKYQYEHMITRPRIPKYMVLSKELQIAIHEALTKIRTPQEALDDAVGRLNLKLEG